MGFCTSQVIIWIDSLQNDLSVWGAFLVYDVLNQGAKYSIETSIDTGMEMNN